MIFFFIFLVLFFFIYKILIETMFKGIGKNDLLGKTLVLTGTSLLFILIILKLNSCRRDEKFEQITVKPTTTEATETDLATAIEQDNVEQSTSDQVVEEVPSNKSLTENTLSGLSGEENKGLYNELLAETQPEVEDTAQIQPQPDVEKTTDQLLVETRQQSDEELKLAYFNSNTILPQDMWFKPLSGAKDLVSGKACMVPVTINTGRLQYADYY